MGKGRKTIAVLSALAMIGTYMPPVSAAEISTSEFAATTNIQCGYERIYRDAPGSTWIMEKPSNPDDESLSISFEANQNEEYVFALMDLLMEKEVAKVTGKAQAGKNEIKMEIDGNTPDGMYSLVGKIGNRKESVESISITGNLALDADITSNYNGTSNLKDLTILNLQADGKPSEKPIEINYTFKHKSKIEFIDVFSSHIGSQDPTEIELYVKENGNYKKIKTFTEFNWEGYVNEPGEDAGLGQPRKKARLQLPDGIETDSIMLKTTKGNTAWNHVVFDEIMVWGHEISDTYKIDIGQSSGTANTVNTITINGKSARQYNNSKVKAELLRGQDCISIAEGQFKDGKLTMELKTPDTISSGEYTVKVTSDDGILKTFNYTVKTEITYEKNIDDMLSVYTSNYKDFKFLNDLNDGKYDKANSVKSVKLWTHDVETDELFSARSIKVYADKDSFSSVVLNVATAKNTNDAFTKALDFNGLSWQEDEKGEYVELFTNYNFLSYGYELVFDKEVDIKEIDTIGTYFEDNLFDGADVLYNGKPFDAHGMTDNSILSDSTFNDNGGTNKQEIVISSNDGSKYSIDKIFLSANFIGQQGPKDCTIFYWQNDEWVEAQSSVDNPIYSGNDQKRQMISFSIPHIETSKLKVEVDFNTDWGKGIISEINAIGTKKQSSSAIAELVEADELSSGSTELRFNNLDKIVKDWEQNFEIKVASSSNVDVVALDGKVIHDKMDRDSQVKFVVRDKKTGEESLTREMLINVPKALSGNKMQADIQIDETTAYKNPAMGWVAYVEGFECAVHDRFEYSSSKSNSDFSINNWNARNKGLCVEVGTDKESAKEYTRQMDRLIEDGMPCNILYIREPWSWFEPVKGQYAWEDENSACHELISWARENNIQLAFRVITCSSACAQQATPEWVFEDGATYVTRNHDYVKNAKDPYLDNSVFQKHFKDLVNAMGKEFNNEGTAFIDAHGHGQWGEMNGMTDISSGADRKKAIQYLEDCFIEAFPDVLLGGQQGSSGGGGAIEESFKTDGNNFVVRRDAFGSQIYLYNTGNANKIKEYRKEGIPVFAENCYHHFDSRNFRWSNNIAYSSGSVGEYGGDNPFNTMKDMMDKVIDHALDCGANTIDLRTLEDAKLWMKNGEEVLDRFTQEGGYRISVEDAVFTKEVTHGNEINVESSWINNGVGILPNNNKRWNKKMKVAYALVDENGKIVQREIVSTDDINAGDFEKGNIYSYNTKFKVDENLPEGQYRLAVSILNEKDNYEVGVQLANKGEITNGGWLTLGNVQVKDEFTDLTVDSNGYADVTFDNDLIIGESATMTVVPKTGYRISKVLVNDVEVSLNDRNQYTFVELPEKMNIKVECEKISEKPEVSFDIKGKGKVEFVGEAVVGKKATLRFTAEEGYRLSCVFINNQIVQLNNNEYVFESLPEKVDVKAVFEPVEESTDKVNVNIHIKGEGSVNFDRDLIVGKSATMEVVPEEGYKIDYVKVNDIEVQLNKGTYLIENLPEILNVEVSFIKDDSDNGIEGKVKLTTQIEGQGNIVFDRSLVAGQKAVMTAVPGNGYMLKEVTVNGKAVEMNDNQYTFEKLPETLDIHAVFVKEYSHAGGQDKNDNVETGDKTGIAAMGALMIASLFGFIKAKRKKDDLKHED